MLVLLSPHGVKNYKVCSLPALSYYMPNPTSTEANKDDIGNVNAGKDAAGDLSKWTDGTEMRVDANAVRTTFYMYENRRGVKTSITEQKDKTKAKAVTNATYVIIKGEAGGYTATWTIYLGANNTSNFNIKRNCCYTYNIQLKEGNIADTRVDVDEKVFPTTVGASSNCYMVAPGHAVTIPVSRANESPIAIGGTKTQIVAATEWEAEIVWQSSPFLVYLSRSTRSGKGSDKRFTVAATDATKQGNAVVAVRNKATKNILWSWHIWVTTYDGSTKFTHNNGNRVFTFMDRTLGASSATAGQLTSCGLMYQWGRKDPFPGIGQQGGSWSVALDTDPIRVYNTSGALYEIPKNPVPSTATPNNLTNATRNPDTFYLNATTPFDWFVYDSSSTQNNDLWSGGNIALGTAVKKSVFDPCPAGWRTPPYLNNVSPFAKMNTGWSWSNYGQNWTGTEGHFPASGYRPYTVGTLHNVRTNGYYWSGASIGTKGCYLTFYSAGVFPLYENGRAFGFPLRCSKDE